MSQQMRAVLESDTSAESFRSDFKHDCQLIHDKFNELVQLVACMRPRKEVTTPDAAVDLPAQHQERRASS